ncbi:MAG: acyl-CoA dehydrogenase family protein, partial [Acidobacteria bacterium]|nr:acyl-CoA dehydrogenase family protein [Acidobacteriota bacterium]
MPPDQKKRSPLSEFSEEENLFKESVANFALQEIRPHVMRMDEQEEIDSEIIKKCFQLGLMGIEIPTSLGGSESTFFMSIVAIEELSRVDASV